MTTSIEKKTKYCIPLENIHLDDLPKVGGKTASLGEMIQELKPLGVVVPGGFGVSSTAYDAVLDRYGLRERLALLLEDIDVTDLDDLADRGRQARQMIVQAGLPSDVRKAIESSYEAMSDGDKPVSVAVRSSATAEDLPTASFAGQQASFLNVLGRTAVADSVLDCLASVFTDRAITYRVHNNFDHMAVKGAVVVQLMVRSDLASSGVAFTLDPDTGFRDVVVITGSYGLGESVVGGKVDPDEIQVGFLSFLASFFPCCLLPLSMITPSLLFIGIQARDWNCQGSNHSSSYWTQTNIHCLHTRSLPRTYQDYHYERSRPIQALLF